MDEIWLIVLSWPFLLVGAVVFLIMAFFNGLGSWKGLGHHLWKTGNKTVRRALRFFEATKVLFLPVFGFALGSIPQIPRPDQLEGSSQLAVALCSMLIVKFIRKSAEARGIDIDLDIDPKEQKRIGML
jgi:hypothetical protein